MKKYFLLGISALMFASCTSHKVVVNRQVEHSQYGQMLLGAQTREQFSTEPFKNWFEEGYSEYEVDETTMQLLKKKKLNSYQITAFVGTWCEDSHREFPRLVKILDALKYPKDKLVTIGLNTKKESPNGEEGLYNIQKVPTFIVKRYGKEIGRITEMPQSGFIEKDLLEIISNKDKNQLEREVNPKQK